MSKIVTRRSNQQHGTRPFLTTEYCLGVSIFLHMVYHHSYRNWRGSRSASSRGEGRGRIVLNPSKPELSGVRHLHTEPWGVRAWATRNLEASFSDSTPDTLGRFGRANPSSFPIVKRFI